MYCGLIKKYLSFYALPIDTIILKLLDETQRLQVYSL